MPNEKVTSSTRDWRSEVMAAEAADLMDRALTGIVYVTWNLPYDRAYEFSNGRRFFDGKGPYE
jgi:hypothetical protein